MLNLIIYAIDNNQKMCYTLAIKINKGNKIGNTMRNISKRYHKNRKNVCFALPIEWISELHSLSLKYGVSFSDVARYAIQSFLKDLKDAHK